MRYLAFALTAALALAGAGAQAATVDFFAYLDGTQEAPPNVSPGSGFGLFVFDDVLKTLTTNVSFSGLVANATAAHIHGPAPPGVNAPVVAPLTVTNATSGAATGFWVGLTPVQEAWLFGGDLYVNIHTSTYPGGEIRGQLQQVPELPASALAAIPGLFAVILRRRR